METTNVDKKQDLSDRCLCTWCVVSPCIPSHCKQLLNSLSICVASILRITYLWLIVFDDVSGGSNNSFTTYSLTDYLIGTIAIPSIWTSLEPGLGIVCGCLPTFPSLFRRWSEHYSQKRNGYGNKLLNFTNNTIVRNRRTKKDSRQSRSREDSTADLRFDQDIEMEN